MRAVLRGPGLLGRPDRDITDFVGGHIAASRSATATEPSRATKWWDASRSRWWSSVSGVVGIGGETPTRSPRPTGLSTEAALASPRWSHGRR
ncbi:hypothetical protein [Streptomyces sp. b94]|uniref:hypothetical protein n=1 Tax=Streptomyces sp. b94 TaxID=1827634 RepID=UPI001FFCAAD3|nr:hypothetical protein [Streptomyces sp. b94]